MASTSAKTRIVASLSTGIFFHLFLFFTCFSLVHSTCGPVVIGSHLSLQCPPKVSPICADDAVVVWMYHTRKCGPAMWHLPQCKDRGEIEGSSSEFEVKHLDEGGSSLTIWNVSTSTLRYNNYAFSCGPCKDAPSSLWDTICTLRIYAPPSTQWTYVIETFGKEADFLQINYNAEGVFPQTVYCNFLRSTNSSDYVLVAKRSPHVSSLNTTTEWSYCSLTCTFHHPTAVLPDGVHRFATKLTFDFGDDENAVTEPTAPSRQFQTAGGRLLPAGLLLTDGAPIVTLSHYNIQGELVGTPNARHAIELGGTIACHVPKPRTKNRAFLSLEVAITCGWLKAKDGESVNITIPDSDAVIDLEGETCLCVAETETSERLITSWSFYLLSFPSAQGLFAYEYYNTSEFSFAVRGKMSDPVVTSVKLDFWAQGVYPATGYCIFYTSLNNHAYTRIGKSDLNKQNLSQDGEAVKFSTVTCNYIASLNLLGNGLNRFKANLVLVHQKALPISTSIPAVSNTLEIKIPDRPPKFQSEYLKKSSRGAGFNLSCMVPHGSPPLFRINITCDELRTSCYSESCALMIPLIMDKVTHKFHGMTCSCSADHMTDKYHHVATLALQGIQQNAELALYSADLMSMFIVVAMLLILSVMVCCCARILYKQLCSKEVVAKGKEEATPGETDKQKTATKTAIPIICLSRVFCFIVMLCVFGLSFTILVVILLIYFPITSLE